MARTSATPTSSRSARHSPSTRASPDRGDALDSAAGTPDASSARGIA